MFFWWFSREAQVQRTAEALSEGLKKKGTVLGILWEGSVEDLCPPMLEGGLGWVVNANGDML